MNVDFIVSLVLTHKELLATFFICFLLNGYVAFRFYEAISDPKRFTANLNEDEKRKRKAFLDV